MPESIRNLTNLQELRLSDNNLTEAEKERIKQLLPNVAIEFTGSISVDAQEDNIYHSLEEALANKDKVFELYLFHKQA